MAEKHSVPSFEVRYRYAPEGVIRNWKLPEHGYGQEGTVKWSELRPPSVAEWVTYLYERDSFEWQRWKRAIGDGDLLLTHRKTGETKEVEVKQGNDGLRHSQVRSMAIRPSSTSRKREVSWLLPANRAHPVDPVACPPNPEQHGKSNPHCDNLSYVTRVPSHRLKDHLRDSHVRGKLAEIYVQDCIRFSILSVRIPTQSELTSIYDGVGRLFPSCCYRLFGQGVDEEKHVKLDWNPESIR